MTESIEAPRFSHLLVVGAGIGGCYAAASLAKYFQKTTVIDRDKIPDSPQPRAGIPQGSHIHGLLRRPLDIANNHLPGLEDELLSAGGLSLRAGLQARYHEGGQWQPLRDLDLNVAAQTRCLLEHSLRQRVLKLNGVSLIDEVGLKDYIIEDDRITGIKAADKDGKESVINADLVIDASGRASRIEKLLSTHGYPDIPSTELGVDIGYVSAYYSRSKPVDSDNYGSIIRSMPPRVRSGVIWPIEDDQWVVSLSGRFGDFPGETDAEFLEFAKQLEDTYIFDIISKEKRTTEFSRFRIPKVYWRHYEKMERFPDRLIPIGDTIAGFNPVYGQGMAAAASQADALGKTLAQVAASSATLDGVSQLVLPELSRAIETPWSMGAMSDLSFEGTAGERPDNFEDQKAQLDWVRSQLSESPEVHKAMAKVANLVAPSSHIFETAVATGLIPTEEDTSEAANA